MQYGISILLSGISLGGQYALIAIGYTMVYGILRLINFAHGDVFMVAGLMLVYLSASLPLAAAIPLMVLLTVLLGFIIERAAYKPLRTAPRMSVMISAIGVSYRDSGPVRPADHCRGIHEICHRYYTGAGGGAGSGADAANQPHEDRHGHAGGIPGL